MSQIEDKPDRAHQVRRFWDGFQATKPFEGAYLEDLNDEWLMRIFGWMDEHDDEIRGASPTSD
jgi:hypothetical protein